MIDIKVPTIGESITEVTLVKWVKQDGDYVERDEVIAEFESEKATFEVNAEKAGVLKTNAAEGDTLNIGSVLAQIDDTAQKSNGAAPAQASAPQAEPAPVAQPSQTATPVAEAAPATKATGKGVIEIKVPTIGESITEVTLLTWIKKEGDLVTRDEVIAEMESEKATFELNARKGRSFTTGGSPGSTTCCSTSACYICSK
jgi:2-oxoglutarate dehydrogenase E2 component (dihydrolipoamide succinyltransferase)